MHIPVTKQQGSIRTVVASFLHFDLCFAIWVLLGSLGIFIAQSLHLNSAQQGILVAIPTLSGSLMRIPVGLLSDRVGSKRVGMGMLAFLFLPLLGGWLLPVNFPAMLGIGLLLGVAGASFAVALPLASRWYPPTQQGLVMGVAAAGNIGTVIANLTAPTLAKAYGWHSVLGLAMIPLAVVLAVFLLLAKESPNRPVGVSASRYLAIVQRSDLWWFCLFYSITFGGFVGLSSFLPLFLHNQYALAPVTAGLITASAAFMGSILRPFGGFLADKFGGVRVLSFLLPGIGALYIMASTLPTLVLMSCLLVVSMSCLGMGNGTVFQLVPQRFQKEIGVATGIVGALGGLGGFFLPILLGNVKQLSGSFGPGLLLLAFVAVGALVALRILATRQKGWCKTVQAAEDQPEVLARG